MNIVIHQTVIRTAYILMTNQLTCQGPPGLCPVLHRHSGIRPELRLRLWSASLLPELQSLCETRAGILRHWVASVIKDKPKQLRSAAGRLHCCCSRAPRDCCYQQRRQRHRRLSAELHQHPWRPDLHGGHQVHGDLRGGLGNRRDGAGPRPSQMWVVSPVRRDLIPLISAYTTPFSLEVFADDATAKVLVSSATTSASGFEMVYQQLPCGM